MIIVNELNKAYPKKGRRKEKIQAISDVSFSADDGNITALLGPNGAGKSTTLRIITGLIHADHGSVNIDGLTVKTNSTEVRRHFGYLPHNAGVYPRLTALENIQYYAEIAGLSRREALSRSKELIDLLEMNEYSDRRTEGFSQGQRTRVALARALVHKPKNLILDEPTNGLDVMATRKLRALLKRLKQEGHCILLSSHIMQEVSLLCDHVAIISDGRIAMADSTENILARTGQQDLEDAFVVAIGEALEQQ